MDDKEFQETLKKGREAIEQSEKLLLAIRQGNEKGDKSVEDFRKKLEEDPFLKKLEEAACSILDRVIERNQIRPTAAPKSKTANRGIGKKLKELLKGAGLTPYELAKKAGVDKGLTYDHVNKNKGCSTSTRKKYAEVLKISPNDFES
jgi:hypothetical protein